MTRTGFQTEYLPLAGTFYQVAFFILEDTAEAGTPSRNST